MTAVLLKRWPMYPFSLLKNNLFWNTAAHTAILLKKTEIWEVYSIVNCYNFIESIENL